MALQLWLTKFTLTHRHSCNFMKGVRYFILALSLLRVYTGVK